MNKIKIILTQEQYDLLTSELENCIEASTDVDEIKRLVDLLKTFEEEYEYMKEEK